MRHPRLRQRAEHAWSEELGAGEGNISLRRALRPRYCIIQHYKLVGFITLLYCILVYDIIAHYSILGYIRLDYIILYHSITFLYVMLHYSVWHCIILPSRLSFGGVFFLAGGYKLVYDSLQMAGPYILRRPGRKKATEVTRESIE